jgi:hypothetical protein
VVIIDRGRRSDVVVFPAGPVLEALDEMRRNGGLLPHTLGFGPRSTTSTVTRRCAGDPPAQLFLR